MKLKIVKNTAKVRGTKGEMEDDCYVVLTDDYDEDDQEVTDPTEKKNAVKKSKSKEKHLKNKRILPVTISGRLEMEIKEDGSIGEIDTKEEIPDKKQAIVEVSRD